jgi:hypothetical protein
MAVEPTRAGCARAWLTNAVNLLAIDAILSRLCIMQNRFFDNYAPVVGYFPAQDIAVAVVATTFGEGACDEQGNYT